MQKLIANDPKTRSADVMAENIEHLKALFPEAFTESKIDFKIRRFRTMTEDGAWNEFTADLDKNVTYTC